MVDLNQFYEWQKQDRYRSVSIEIGNPNDNTHFRVWVYDFRLGVGQSVNSVEEIDLESKLKEREYERYLSLKQKFEEGV